MFDETCLIAIEINNQINEEKRKKKEALKKQKDSFQKDMAYLFENENGEL